MKFKIGVLVGLLIIIGFVSIIIYQNNRINTLSEYISQINNTISLLDSSVNSINKNLESQKKDIGDLLSSSNNIESNNIPELTYELTDQERRIYELESIVKALPNVEHKMAYIKHIKKANNQIEVALDFVECFYGEAATKAAKEDGINGVFESTGLYIRNKDLKEEIFLVPENFVTYVLNGSSLNWSSISDSLSDIALGYGNGYYRLFNVFIVGNKITVIEEQYIS